MRTRHLTATVAAATLLVLGGCAADDGEGSAPDTAPAGETAPAEETTPAEEPTEETPESTEPTETTEATGSSDAAADRELVLTVAGDEQVLEPTDVYCSGVEDNIRHIIGKTGNQLPIIEAEGREFAMVKTGPGKPYRMPQPTGISYDEDSELTGLTVEDDLTFTIKLTQPEADFPSRLGYSAFYPLPPDALEDPETYGENPVGNGPYQLKEEGAWQHNVGIDMVPNEDYAGEREVQNGGVSLVFYDSQDAAYNDLLSGELDIIDQIPDSAFGSFEDELGDRAVNQPSAVFQSFTIPEYLDHFEGEEGKLRRQAISHAINREEITETLFEGTRTPAADFTSPVVDGWTENVPGNEVLEYDAEKAKELWAEADDIAEWEGTFTLAYNSDAPHQPWVDAVVNQLRNSLDIEAEGEPYPLFAELRDDVTARDMDGAFRTGWQADYPGLGNFLGPLYGTGAGSNDGDYSNEDFDEKLKDAAGADSVDEANTLYVEAQEYLFEDLPALPLWYQNVIGGYAETVDNVEFGWNSVPVYHDVTKVE